MLLNNGNNVGGFARLTQPQMRNLVATATRNPNNVDIPGRGRRRQLGGGGIDDIDDKEESSGRYLQNNLPDRRDLFTVFGPSNFAFQQTENDLVLDIIDHLFNGGITPDQFRSDLETHILDGFKTFKDLDCGSAYTMISGLDTETLCGGGGPNPDKFQVGGLNDPLMLPQIVNRNNYATNGVLQLVDRVILP